MGPAATGDHTAPEHPVAVAASPPPGPPTDEATRRGAVAEMVATHGKALMGYCLRMTRDAADAEDVVQQVFLEAFRDFDKFRSESSRKTWLFGIAHHRCLDSIKMKGRRIKRIKTDEKSMEDSPDLASRPNDRMDRGELTVAIDDCLAHLSPRSRMTVFMRFWLGYSFAEMSRLLDATADALQVRVARAMPVLERCLTLKGWSGE